MTERAEEIVQIGDYLAKVPVDLISDETGWSPYLSHEDALKVTRVRKALQAGDIAAAAREAKIFELREVA